MSLNDDVKKVMMAGIGALSAVAEKTQEALDSLAKKGEEALEHGQVLNEKLRHKIRQAFSEEGAPQGPGKADLLRALERLSPEERKEILEKLEHLKRDGE